MRSLNLRPSFLVVALLAMSLAVWLAGCAYAEPPPPCPVAAGSALGVGAGGNPLPRLPDFWAKYTLASGNATDSCAQLVGEEVAFQKFSTPTQLTNFTLALRSYRMGYQQGNANDYGSADYVGDLDFTFPDGTTGGAAEGEGTNFNDPTGGSDFVIRQDPNDPQNKLMSAIGSLTGLPDATNICTASGFSAADETWPEIDVPLYPGGENDTSVNTGNTDPLQGTAVILDDGGTKVAVFPTLHEKYEWDSVKIISTTEIPGTVFSASLRYTENTCTATYNVFGIWPLTPCHTDLDCSPTPLPSAGVCMNACSADTTVGTCDMTHYCDAGIEDDDAGIPAPLPSDPGVCVSVGDAGTVCAAGDVSIATRLFQGSGLNPAFVGSDGGMPATCNTDPQIQFQMSTNGIGSDWGVCEINIPAATLQQQPN